MANPLELYVSLIYGPFSPPDWFCSSSLRSPGPGEVILILGLTSRIKITYFFPDSFVRRPCKNSTQLNIGNCLSWNLFYFLSKNWWLKNKIFRSSMYRFVIELNFCIDFYQISLDKVNDLHHQSRTQTNYILARRTTLLSFPSTLNRLAWTSQHHDRMVREFHWNVLIARTELCFRVQFKNK